MNYKEAMEYLREVQQQGMVLGLESIRTLMKYLGNPQDDLRFIHIAGTNGKGSTLAFLSTILQCAGYLVGRYSSPLLLETREQIQVNDRSISKGNMAKHITQIQEAVSRLTEDGHSSPTPFEIETALAFLYFRARKCDIVVLETGLGGRMDATNIIHTTVAAVLTSISMDHMAFLGNTLTKIAENKAGIIKNGCYVITADQKPEVMEVLTRVCQEQRVPLSLASREQCRQVKYGIKKQSFTYGDDKKLEISLAGTCQIANAALAVETVRRLTECGYPVSREAVYRGLLETKWIGRFSVIAEKPYFIVDGAHNEEAAVQLAESIRFYFEGRKIIYIMGILKDKEYGRIIQETYVYAEHVITVTTPGNPRAMPAYDLAGEIRKFHSSVTAADSLQEAVEMGYLLADKDSVILAFGSLSYLGELITIVKNRDTIRRDAHGKSE